MSLLASKIAVALTKAAALKAEPLSDAEKS